THKPHCALCERETRETPPAPPPRPDPMPPTTRRPRTVDTSMHLSLSRLWYTGPPMKGGTTYGQCTVHRCAGPPHRVPPFHELDPGGISDAGPALRGSAPSAYGHVAPR